MACSKAYVLLTLVACVVKILFFEDGDTTEVSICKGIHSV
jgi:hypothetical protein